KINFIQNDVKERKLNLYLTRIEIPHYWMLKVLIGRLFGGSGINSTPSIAHLRKIDFSMKLRIKEQNSSSNS
ncbi:hypothetical protein TorRG33x02_010320, partial [Trema orientale]